MKDKKHKEGFDIPNQYFEEFESRLFDRINIELLPKSSGFKVPEGYFNELEKQIIHQVKKPINKTKVISILSRKTILYAATIAALAVLIFSIVNNQNKALTLDEIEFSSIKTYIEEGYIEIDNSDLSLLFTEEDLSAITLEENYISEEILNEKGFLFTSENIFLALILDTDCSSFKLLNGSPSSNKSSDLITVSLVTVLPITSILSTNCFCPSKIFILISMLSSSKISFTECSINCKSLFAIIRSSSSNNFLTVNGE